MTTADDGDEMVEVNPAHLVEALDRILWDTEIAGGDDD